MIVGITKNSNLEEIIKSCQRFEEQGQEKLYHLFSKTLFGICLRYGRDYNEAEDMLQEAFIKIFRKIDKYDFSGSFPAWLSRLVSNNCIDMLRKKSNLYTITEEKAYAIPSSMLSAMDKLNEENLLEIIQALPIGYRTVFNMYVIEGYSHKEIADRLEINEGTSKSQLNRARNLLQKKILELQNEVHSKKMNG
ncbi:MAG: sigma-70 family RNA polymerase sigma factor [Chitinophagales bacterium]|nr:sigma-70 family RNA polymerase sigma factor [Chitinophagales bacterium]